MVIKHLLYLIIVILLYGIQCQNNETNETLSSEQVPKNELEAVFRIDSLYNNNSLYIQGDDIILINSKGGNKESFLITSTFLNSYFIINREENKRLGIDKEHKICMYPIDDKDNLDKTYWNIIKYNNISNVYLIQNTFSKNYLEINTENNELICKNIVKYETLNNLDNTGNEVKFHLFKLFEEVQIRPIDIEKLNKEPIDIIMKYTDYTDKSLNRDGINEKKKEKDMEELRYSLRSILKYIPWIRKIFIVMPNEKVRFLKPIEEIKDKFVYVKEKDLIGFDTMNSVPLQLNLFKLEKYGISENFIYMDDNYFIGGDLKKTDFFYYDDISKKVMPSIVNNIFVELDKENTLNEYKSLFNEKESFNAYDYLGWKLSMLSSQKLIIDNFDMPLINVEFTHNALPLNINELKEIHNLIITKYKYANEILCSVERNILDLQPQQLFNLYGLNVKKRKVHSIEYNYLSLIQIENNYLYTKLIGINTGGDGFTSLHENGKKVLSERFSEPTKYEIDIGEKKEIIDEKENNIYRIKDELKIIEEKYKNELNYQLIIYWGLIIGIIVVLIVLSYYFFELNKNCKFCKNFSYDIIKQDETQVK